MKNYSNSTGLVLVGGGGHGKSTLDVIRSCTGFDVVGVLDDTLPEGSEVSGFPVLGSDKKIEGLIAEGNNSFVLGLGYLGRGNPRQTCYERIKKLGGNFPVIISAHAVVSPLAVVGEGTVVHHGAVVNAHARIGSGCIINTSSVIEHDSVVGDHCHVSTNATVNGEVVLGDGCFIGSGAVINQGLELEKNTVVGSGAVVNRSLQTGTWVGVPARQIR